MEELLKKLEIDDLKELEYFEPFCTLMELEDPIEEDIFFDVLMGLDYAILQELIDSYLDEVMAGVPDDSIDLYTLVSSYKRSTKGFLRAMEEEGNKAAAIGEIYRFRKWYGEEKLVFCRNLESSEQERKTLCEALFLARMERLSVGSYEYDFTDCLDFEYEDYDDEMEDWDPDEELYEREEDDPNITLIDKWNPVIDGEQYEEEEGETWLQ